MFRCTCKHRKSLYVCLFLRLKDFLYTWLAFLKTKLLSFPILGTFRSGTPPDLLLRFWFLRRLRIDVIYRKKNLRILQRQSVLQRLNVIISIEFMAVQLNNVIWLYWECVQPEFRLSSFCADKSFMIFLKS